MSSENTKNRKIIIGLGSGRSGTASLAFFLDSQSDSYVVHESSFGLPGLFKYTVGNYLPWETNERAFNNWYNKLQSYSRSHQYYGDVCSSLIQYVPQILALNPDVVFVCLKRDKKKVVNSFKKITFGVNHWKKTTLNKYFDYWYDMYPKYLDDSKDDAVSKYWDQYYSLAESYQSSYVNFRIFSIEDLNSESGRDAILEHIGIPSHKRIITGAFHINKSIPVLLAILIRLVSFPRNVIRRFS